MHGNSPSQTKWQLLDRREYLSLLCYFPRHWLNSDATFIGCLNNWITSIRIKPDYARECAVYISRFKVIFGTHHHGVFSSPSLVALTASTSALCVYSRVGSMSS